MDTEPFSIDADPTLEDVRFLEDRLYEYNVEKQVLTTDSGWRSFSGMLSRPSMQGSKAGPGVRVATSASVWVHKDLRGQGIGMKLSAG